MKTFISIRKPLLTIFVMLGILSFSVRDSQARNFYVDPSRGTPSGDGSVDNPWDSLERVFEGGLIETRFWDSLPYSKQSVLEAVNPGAPIKAGDTIFLRAGNYQDLEVHSAYNTENITLAAAPGEVVQARTISVEGASNWTIRGIQVSPSFAKTYENSTMVSVSAGGHLGPSNSITFEELDTFCVDDISNWSAADWNKKSCDGILLRGSLMTVRRSRFRNVNFAIVSKGRSAVVEYNQVENFAGDGIRGLGDHSLYQYNDIRNAYRVNDNHDDGFQSWAGGGDDNDSDLIVKGVIVRGNTFVNYSDPKQKHRAEMQGIGCFDGFYDNWLIENNVVMIDHWHGISFFGGRDSLVINNTITDLNNEAPGPPGVVIQDHKTAGPTEGMVVRNNLVSSLDMVDNVVADHNIVFENVADHFVDFASGNLRLLKSSTAIDQGSTQNVPWIDRDRIARPQGSAPDIGAYEWHKESVNPEREDDGLPEDFGSDSQVPQMLSGGCQLSSSPTKTTTALLWILLLMLMGAKRRKEHHS